METTAITEENGEFCVAARHRNKTAGILTQLVKALADLGYIPA